MKRWESLVDRLIRDVIGDGNIIHLPGAGQPLNLNDDAHTPDDMRLVFKIMKDHNVAPDWIMAGTIIDQMEEKLRKQIEIRANRYQRDLSHAQSKGTIIKEIEIEESWRTFLEDFSEKVKKHNQEILFYNLKVPDSIPHKQILLFDNLVKKTLSNKKGD